MGTPLYKKLVDQKEALAVVGLGYVGMPLAVAFAKKLQVIGYDRNEEKIEAYLRGEDPTEEVGGAAVKKSNVGFTYHEEELDQAKFFVIAVPTPINSDKTPDLRPVEGASKTVGRHLTKGSVVVYESTVYPGVTEEICVPILEHESKLKCGVDFKVGYSPERINPGDKVHRLENIIKIVSGCDKDALEEIAKTYELIIEAGVHRASSIKVAEAAKVVENSQRDINIAFINELAMAFDKMDIDTKEVIEAMNTKWNSLGFYPGLVGGHCIGVDPYYFIYEAEKLGYHSQIISSGRRVNDDMPRYVAESIVKQLILANKRVKGARILFMGATFKENCPDVRNSKIMEILECLKEYEPKLYIVDPLADADEIKREYGYKLSEMSSIHDIDCVVLAVAHNEYVKAGIKGFEGYFADYPQSQRVIIDIKGVLDKEEAKKKEFRYWRL